MRIEMGREVEMRRLAPRLGVEGKRLVARICSKLAAFAIVASQLAWISPAAALSYDLALGFSTPDKLGLWVNSQKYTTASTIDGTPVNVGSITHLDTELAGYDFDTFFIMGSIATPSYNSAISSGAFSLTNSAGVDVLTGTYLSDGRVSAVPTRGSAGQIDLRGLFTVTGGLVFDDNVLRGIVYLEMFFDSVFALGGGDMGAINGQINIYSRPSDHPPTDEVPEPAALLLFGCGLLGAVRARKNQC
jgi:hypothetical protein